MNEKKKKELSNKYSLTRIILFVVLIVGTLIICGFFAHLCNDNLENNEKDYFTEREYAVSILTNSVELFNNARYEYDPVYDKMAKAILADFQDDFKNAGGTADSVNLEELRQKYISRYSQDLNLYIIDSKSTILKTTEEGAEGYNFDILPEFQERLQQMRLANEMEVDPLLQSYTSKDKVQMKWAYIPSIDHKYLLEIGLLIQSPFNNQDNIYPTTGLIPENYLTSVFFFTQNALIKDDPKEGLQRLGSLSKNLTYLPERKEYLNRSFKGQESFYIDIPEQNERIYYSYIPSPVQDSPSSRYTDRVLEIAFDINPLIEQQQDSIKLYLNFTVISVFGLIIFGIIISKFVVKPVDNIINDIEIIADGDYDHEIHATHGLEFYRLELSIKKMIDSLKEELKVNQQKTVELDKELNMRLIAEKNLINAGRKLQFAEKIAHHGSFEVIKKDLTPEWSEELIKIMGHDPETFKPLPDTFFDQISPDNSEIVNSAFEKMLQDGTNTDISFWIKRPNGEGRYVRMVAEVSDLKEDGARIFGSIQDNTPYHTMQEEDGARIFGSIQDNTSYHILQQERDMAAAQVTDLYNNAPCGYYSVNSDLAIVAINDTFLNMLQYSRDEVNGGIITDFMPENYITEYRGCCITPMINPEGKS